MTPTGHAELARLAEAAYHDYALSHISVGGGMRATVSVPAFIEAVSPSRVLALLAEIAALRASASVIEPELGDLEATNADLAQRLTQAERQRDEAVEIMKDVQRCTQGPTLDRRITAFLASMEPKT